MPPWFLTLDSQREQCINQRGQHWQSIHTVATFSGPAWLERPNSQKVLLVGDGVRHEMLTVRLSVVREVKNVEHTLLLLTDNIP